MTATLTMPKERRSLFTRARRSAGNEQLHDLKHRADELLDLVREYLAEHPPACKCDNCRFRSIEAEDIQVTLNGLAFNLEMGAGWLANFVVGMEPRQRARRT